MRQDLWFWLAVAALAVSFSVTWSNPSLHGQQPDYRAKPSIESGPPDDDSGDDARMSPMGRLAHLGQTGRLEKALAKAPGLYVGKAGLIQVEEILEAELDEEDDVGEGPAGGQAETSIAVDSTGNHIVVGVNDTRGFSLNPISVSGFMYSDDGGSTFIDGGQLPVTTGTSTIGTTVYPQIFGDPEVKYLGGSNFIYFSIMVKKLTATGTAMTMCVHRSADYGHTWTGPFEIAPATNPHGLLSGANARDSADKEFADVDPDSGRVLMSWSNFTSVAFAPGGVEISTTFSDDIMAPAGPTWSPRSIIAATAADGQASIPRFAGGGSSNVYVSWRRFASGLNFNTGFARSTNNGASFGAPVNLAVDFKTMDYVLGNDRVNTSPSLAVDNSIGPNQGNIYVVYPNNTNNDGADIAFQRSLDGGVTFLAPVLINSRPGHDRAQWFPWVTVDGSNGRIYVLYYDQRIPFGDLTEVSIQHSDDGGMSWSKPVSLNDRPFHAGHGNDTGQPNLGDYNQAVAQADELFATFAQTTQRGFTDGLPSASMTTPDAAFKRIPGSASPLSLAVGPVTFIEPENGFIDRGDLVRFTFPLVNYVTNIINASAVTGISATLSTSTPGVSVVTATRSYPDIGPGASVSNIGTFDVQIDQTFVPGTHVEFALAVSAATGSSLLLFTQSTGTPVAIPLFQQNFDTVPPGALPAGWSTSHAGGNNTVPWTTSTFVGNGTNAAFHQNANDGLSGNHTRFERLFSPLISVPATAEYVNLDFDVAYNSEDDPDFNLLAYDGFLLRITDFGPNSAPPALVRSVLAEAFTEEFTTGAQGHYPKHFPRSSNPAYFEDMSAWAGASAGIQHIHMKLPGMAGRFFQLRWEFAQDSIGTCVDVRPGSGPCGVAFDNIVIASVVSQAGVRTRTSVASSQNPSDSGEAVSLRATVTAGSPVTVGSVVFKEGGSTLSGPTPVDASGQATFTPSALAPGSHILTAEYDGPAGFRSSIGEITQIVDPLPAVTIDNVEVIEGHAGTTDAVFTVQLSAPTHTATAQVDFATADGTATVAGNDYTPAAGTVSVAPGTTTATIVVSVTGDAVFEPNETFFVNLTNATHATIADDQALGTVGNDDGMPAVSINDVSADEGNAGTAPAVFSASLSNPSSDTVSVHFATTKRTATARSDYTTTNGTLTFAPLETTKTLTVQIKGDFVIEPAETFAVRLSGAINATIADSRGIGTIVNDDTVASTLAALSSQVNAAGGLTQGQRRMLLKPLAEAQRGLSRGRADEAADALKEFIEDVEKHSRRDEDAGKKPQLDASTATKLIAEARSIIGALGPDAGDHDGGEHNADEEEEE